MDEANTAQPGHDEVIEPVKLRLAEGGLPPGRPPPPERRSVIAVGSVLAALIVVAIGVFLVLPSWVEERAEQRAPDPTPVEQPVADVPAAPQLTPEELERLREQAEALLAELLPQQARLAELSAESWGGAQWEDYENSSRTGDDAYLANAYQDAVPAYAHAIEVGNALLDRSVDIIAAALAAGTAALEAGTASVAQEQFTLVLNIEPENQAAAAGLARAEHLPDVLALTQNGESLARDGSLDEAAAAFREALAIDSAWVPAREALAAVEARIRARSFEALMSQGFAALAREDFDEAYERFSDALGLRPGSEDAANGRLQAEQGQRLDQIALMEARAAAFERRELWPEAIEQYERALGEDATLVFAQQGIERARARADLDTKLAHLLENPNLLFDDRVLADARVLLGDAADIAEPGPRLAEQTAELDRLLRLASTPIKIELQSDELTEVTVYRVGPLGTFAETTLELRPGTYTAIGSRDGYRDVRETFTILPGRPVPPIRVACVEPI